MYISLLNIFEEYEKHALLEYTNNKEDELIFFRPENTKICEKIVKLKQNIKNPFTNIYYWVEFEVRDMTAMQQALTSLDNLNLLLEKKKTELNGLNNELCNINSTYTKLKLFFKFKSINTYQYELNDDIQKTQNMINTLNELIILASKQMESEINQFQIEKLKKYNENLELFAEAIKDNSQCINDLWECVGYDPKLKSIYDDKLK